MHRSSRFFVAALVTLAACSSDNSGPNPTCTVSSVAISGAPATLDVGATAQLTANVTSQDCGTAPAVTWSTSAAGVASVSSSGLVSGIAAGPVVITAMAGGKSGSANITVQVVPVASVRVLPDSIVIGVGAGPVLLAEALDAADHVLTGRTIAWTSLAPGNAAISATGQLTGVTGATTANVTATAEGHAGNAVVHVVRQRVAFFWNNWATPAGTQTPSGGYAYNELGGAMQVTSNVTGQYNAAFAGNERALSDENEAMFVSAYGSPLGAYCGIVSWGDTSTGVDCHAANGSALDTRFDVALIGSAAFSGRSAFAWISTASSTGTADHFYRFNPTGGEITSTYQSTGRYTVTFAGLGRAATGDREAVMVNAYGGGGAQCQPASWNTLGDDLAVEVRCFDAAGAAADSRYVILVLDGPRSGATLGFAVADQPANASYAPTNSAVRPTGSVLITRTGPGLYHAAFTGFWRSGLLQETFLVTAIGETPGRCVIGGWSYSIDVATPATIDITCSTTAGVAADMPFSLLALQ